MYLPSSKKGSLQSLFISLKVTLGDYDIVHIQVEGPTFLVLCLKYPEK